METSGRIGELEQWCRTQFWGVVGLVCYCLCLVLLMFAFVLVLYILCIYFSTYCVTADLPTVMDPGKVLQFMLQRSSNKNKQELRFVYSRPHRTTTGRL